VWMSIATTSPILGSFNLDILVFRGPPDWTTWVMGNWLFPITNLATAQTGALNRPKAPF
jgi:hypothetical protein